MTIQNPKKWPCRVAIPLLFLFLANVSSSSIAPRSNTNYSPLTTATAINTKKPSSPGQNKQPRAFIQQPPAFPSDYYKSPARGGGTTYTPPRIVTDLTGASYFVALDLIIRKLFQKRGVNFPSMMAGCMSLFAVMITAEAIRPGYGDAIFRFLNPGASFLTRWMPVCFVPGLVMLPLAPKIGDGLEVTKFLSAIVLGLIFSLLSISYSVLTLRTLRGQLSDPATDDVNLAAQKALEKGRKTLLDTASKIAHDGADSVVAATKKGKDATLAAAAQAAQQGKNQLLEAASRAAKEAQESVTKAAFNAAEKALPLPPPPKPYSEAMVRQFATGAAVFGAATVYATLVEHPSVTPLRMLFMMCTSVGSFVFGARLPPSFNKVCHPLVTSTLLTLVATAVTGQLTKQSFRDVLSTYKANSLSPLAAGAGDYLLFALGPAVCSLSIAMYSRKDLMKENLLVVLVATLVSSAGGLFSTAAFVRLVNQTSKIIRLSLLTRNVTTALAIPITKMLSGDISICACVCVLTGIVGATVGARILTALGIVDPVSRGLGIGGSSFALGAASIVHEKDAFPFAAIGMVCTAVMSTCLVSIPFVKEVLVQLATGGMEVVQLATGGMEETVEA